MFETRSKGEKSRFYVRNRDLMISCEQKQPRINIAARGRNEKN